MHLDRVSMYYNKPMTRVHDKSWRKYQHTTACPRFPWNDIMKADNLDFIMEMMFCTSLFLIHSQPAACGPSKWAKQICATTSLHLHRAWSVTIISSHVLRICTGTAAFTGKCFFPVKPNLTIFPPNPVRISHHIHHHFLWRVFPVAKGFEINLKEKWEVSWVLLHTLTAKIQSE